MYEASGGEWWRSDEFLAAMSPAARAAYLADHFGDNDDPGVLDDPRFDPADEDDVEVPEGLRAAAEEATRAGQWAHDLERARACPVSVGELHARLFVDEGGSSRLPDTMSDDEILTWVRRAVALEQHAQWLRSVGVAQLQSRWSPSDTDALIRGQADAGRRQRMAQRRRKFERADSRALTGPDHGQDSERGTDRVDPERLAEHLVAAEVALACGVSERAVRDWVRTGSCLVYTPLPELGDALCAGRLDWAKAHAVAEMIADRPEAIGLRVDDAVVDLVRMPDPVTGHGPDPLIRNVPTLRQHLTSLLLLLDPEGEVERDDQERRTRRVTTRRVSAHLAELVAVLPIEQIAAIASRLDQAVHDAKLNKDPRTADQVRADTLLELTTGLLVDPPITPPTGADTQANTGAPTKTDTPQDANAETTSHAETTSTAEEPATARQAADPPSQPSPSPSQPSPLPSLSPSPSPLPLPERSGCSCGGRASNPVGVNVTLVMTLETLLGLRDDPAHLDGYGPLAADLARDLATNGTFRCAAIDDEHSTILGLGQRTFTDRYRPGQRLQDLARATWRRCSFPGCRSKAIKTGQGELDHSTPWPAGPTCSCNLAPACKRHHQLKTHGRLVVEPSTDPRDPPGSLRWRLPSGRTYTSRPDPTPTDRTLLQGIRTGPGAENDADPPPF